MRTFLAALLLCALPAGAQTTWHGLSFGMSRDDARSLLASQGIQVENNNDGDLEGTGNAQIMLPGLTQTIPVRPELRFTEAGGLMDVTLSLDFTAAKQNLTQYHTDIDILAFVADRTTRALTAKYSSPIFSTPGCDNDPHGSTSLDCTTTFHATGQSVAIDWANHPAHLFIRYQMLSPDL